MCSVSNYSAIYRFCSAGITTKRTPTTRTVATAGTASATIHQNIRRGGRDRAKPEATVVGIEASCVNSIQCAFAMSVAVVGMDQQRPAVVVVWVEHMYSEKNWKRQRR